MSEDSLTASVARLHRAGSEDSQQTKKLRLAVDSLLLQLKEIDFSPLPCSCRLYPSGEFVQTELSNPPFGTDVVVFKVTIGKEHSLPDLFAFSRLIASGFLDKLSEGLESRAKTFGKTSAEISKFISPE